MATVDTYVTFVHNQPIETKQAQGSTMQNEGVGPEEHDFIGEMIAEDNEARRLRTIHEQLKPAPRLSDDPSVRLAECRGKAVKTTCCQISAQTIWPSLMAAGDYTPEELFGAGGTPSCPSCAKPSAPPAGDVEVVGWKVESDYTITELVDRAHVTRLQAEIDPLKTELEKVIVDKDRALQWLGESDVKVNTLQSELTKARELNAVLQESVRGYVEEKEQAFLANQPARKTGAAK